MNGILIDQTDYFRNTVFGFGTWTVEKQSPRVETAEFQFNISLAGRSYGVHRLTVSHKPTGEAGQHNYTTGIRWGDLNDTVRSGVDVTNMTLSLYAPNPISSGVFVLDIA